MQITIKINWDKIIKFIPIYSITNYKINSTITIKFNYYGNTNNKIYSTN